jgi:glycosyltransferase involved in cell wall biosynthesis
MKRYLHPVAASAPIAISRYGSTGASTRVRLIDWFSHVGLPAERWDYLGASDNQVRTLLPRLTEIAREEWRLRISNSGLNGRTVIMSRGASPFSSGSLEESLLRRAAFSVYDFDDAIYVRSPSPMRRFWSEKRAWERSVKAADIVIAGSEVLAESAAAIRDDVILIPSCVEPGKYTLKQDYEIMGNPVAVWIGTPSTERFLGGIADALLSLHRRWGLRVRVVSAGGASLGALDPMVDRIPWNVDTFQHHLTSADLGIMPLPDTLFERGKCAYKLLQYGATGLPTVGSPVGANIQALERLGGVAAGSSSQGWEDSISSIIEATVRERTLMGAAGRNGVETHYSYGSWADTWLAATRLGNMI